MVFAHDTEMALAGTAALVNTTPGIADGAVEGLPDAASLDEFLDTWQWTGARSGDEAELKAVRGLRPRLARLWSVNEDEAVTMTNEMLVDAKALPQLVRHGDWGYHLHATALDAPLTDRMVVETAMAMIDVIRMGEMDRLRVCAGADCQRVIVDLSKNRSRRFCDSGCGNRANVAAFRARRQVPGRA